MPRAANVGDYIRAAPAVARKPLRELRAILKKAAPKATESIKWGVPVFEETRILFAYAAFKSHLNFMPTPATLKVFAKELAGYPTGKGSIRFEYGKPLPKSLIRRIAARRVRDLRERDARWM